MNKNVTVPDGTFPSEVTQRSFTGSFSSSGEPAPLQPLATRLARVSDESAELRERPVEQRRGELGALPVRVASRYSHNSLEMASASHVSWAERVAAVTRTTLSLHNLRAGDQSHLHGVDVRDTPPCRYVRAESWR